MSKKRWIYFKEWLSPKEELCKKRGVKLSNKNKARLNSLYIDVCLAEHGNTLNTMFRAMYGDYILESINRRNFLKIEKTSAEQAYSISTILFP